MKIEIRKNGESLSVRRANQRGVYRQWSDVLPGHVEEQYTKLPYEQLVSLGPGIHVVGSLSPGTRSSNEQRTDAEGVLTLRSPPGFRFSLLAMLLLTLAMAVTFAFCFSLRPGQFAFESFESAYYPLTIGGALVRLLVVSPLVAMESVGLMLIYKEYKHQRRR